MFSCAHVVPLILRGGFFSQGERLRRCSVGLRHVCVSMAWCLCLLARRNISRPTHLLLGGLGGWLCPVALSCWPHEHSGLLSDALGTVTVVRPHEWVRRGEGSEPSTSTCAVEMTPSRFSEAAQCCLGLAGWTVYKSLSYWSGLWCHLGWKALSFCWRTDFGMS